MEQEPFIAEARTYIVKGCRPTIHQMKEGVDVLHTGFRDNRRFMVTEWDEEHGRQRFISQRHKHHGERLAIVTPRLEGDSLILNAEGMQQCRMPLKTRSKQISAEVQEDVVAVIEHPEGSRWMSEFLKRKCLLVQQDGPRRVDHQAVRHQAEGRLADRHPIRAIGVATLERVADLVRKDEGRDVTVQELIDAFRPNLVLDNLKEKEEHDMKSMVIGIGSLMLQRSVQCVRCDVPDVHQQTGERGKGIMNVVSTYFRHPTTQKPLMGEQFRPITTGSFTVGDTLRHIDWKRGGFGRPLIPRKPQ